MLYELKNKLGRIRRRLPRLSRPAYRLFLTCLLVHTLFNILLAVLLSYDVIPPHRFFIYYKEYMESQRIASALTFVGVIIYDCEIKKQSKKS